MSDEKRTRATPKMSSANDNPMQSGIPHAICGAKTRSGQECKARPLENGRCRMHGGTTPHGMASPRYKHGRYSKYLPAHLAKRYRESVKDPELLALRDDVGLIDTRLSDVLKKLDTSETSKRWLDVSKWFGDLRKALASNDKAKGTECLARLNDLILGGANETQAWMEIVMLLEQRRRLVESERKRLVEMQMMMTSEQAMLFLNRVTDAVRKHVTDKDILSNIADEFRDIVTFNVRRTIDAGSDASAQIVDAYPEQSARDGLS